MHLKAHKLVQQWCFFRYSLATSMAHRVKIFTDLLFYAYVGLPQVRILVFDNYQKCPVPLSLIYMYFGICTYGKSLLEQNS